MAVRQPYRSNHHKNICFISQSRFGKIPDLARGKVPEDWWYFPVVARLHSERTGYPTQKPAALMERIILASSNPGDMVADFFCGSGTTPATATQLGRNFIASDITWRAIHTTKSRLLSQNCPPFIHQVCGDDNDIKEKATPAINEKPEFANMLHRTAEMVEVEADFLHYWISGSWECFQMKSYL
jgi:hypothetical protein